MRHSLLAVRGYSLRVDDREFGEVVDFLIDSRTWSVRFLVARTRRLLPGREVAIATADTEAPNRRQLHVPVTLTRDELKQSLLAAEVLHDGMTARVIGPAEAMAAETGDLHRFASLGEINLVSTRDGSLGRVVDLIINDQTWTIQSLVIELDGMGRERLTLHTEWIAEMAGSGKTYTTNLSAAAVTALTAGLVIAVVERRAVDAEYDALYDQDGRSRTWLR